MAMVAIGCVTYIGEASKAMKLGKTYSVETF